MKFGSCAAALLMRAADKTHMVGENIRMVKVCVGLLLGGAEWHRTQHRTRLSMRIPKAATGEG